MSTKPGAYGNCKSRASKNGGDSLGGGNVDAPPPRLVSLYQMRKEKRLKDELYGDAAKEARSKVSLPKFSWDKEQQ